MIRRMCGISMACVLVMCLPGQAATWYVDYDGGDDANAGTRADQAFQRCPGDRNATGAAAKTTFEAGDVVRFKGGVVYRGSIRITRSGAEGRPIVYDGNADGTYGTGPAIIDGSAPLTGLTQCRSAEEAWGNPNYRKLYWAYVPTGARWRTINLCEGNQVLPISQDPNPADPLFQERPSDYVGTAMEPPRTLTDVKVRYLSADDETGNRPLISMFDDSGHSAVIQGLNGKGVIEIQTPQPVTATELAMTPMARYGQPKEVSFLVDGVEILRANLAHHPDKSVEQRFPLAAPVTFSKLEVRFLVAHPGDDGRPSRWGAVQKIAAYDAAGANVLLTKRTSVLTHEGYFTQAAPEFFDNAVLALYAQPAAVYYKRILQYEPQIHRIRIETLSHGQVPYSRGGAFAVVNSIRLIDRPGEYALTLDAEPDGRHKVFVWPPSETDGAPEDLTYGRYGVGFNIEQASYVTVQGFSIRKQGWTSSSGISARGKATDLTIRDVTVSGLRGNGAGIAAVYVDNVLVDDSRILDNAGHTKGIVIRLGSNVVVRDCELRRNTSTALDYYTVTNGAVQGCTLTDNRGMHANGLTFYLGCKNILVEGNTVLRGNSGLTVQHGENMIVRNNIFSGSPGIGLWSGRPYNNIVITNNYIRFSGAPGGTMGAIYGGNRGARGYTIANNIIEGLSGNVLRKAEIHHNILTQYGPVLTKATLGDNLYIPDAAAVVVDLGDDRFGPAPNSAAVDGGVALATINATDINRVLRRGPVDIGPWESGADGTPEAAADPRTFTFSLDGYTIGPPMLVGTGGYESLFEPVAGGDVIVTSALDHTGEGGGKSGKRLNMGFVMNWDNPGHWLRWTVDAPAAGPYELVIDHASEMPSARKFVVNGAPVEGLASVHFHATGSWHDFSRKALPVALELKAGPNTIDVWNVRGSLNFRTLRLIPVTSPAPSPPRVVAPDDSRADPTR